MCYGSVACLIYFFDYPNFGERGAPRGSTMVPLDGELVSSHRLSIQTTLVSDTVWPQFAMQVLTAKSEMGSLNSPVTTSYRLPIVTIGLSLTVFAVLWMLQTDGQTDGWTELV